MAAAPGAGSSAGAARSIERPERASTETSSRAQAVETPMTAASPNVDHLGDGLDEASWTRVARLTEQSLANTKVDDQDGIWLTSFEQSMKDLVGYVIKDDLLDRLWTTKQAINAVQSKSSSTTDTIELVRASLANSGIDKDVLPRLHLFDLHVQTVPHSLTISVGEQARVEFLPDQYQGDSLFGRSQSPGMGMETEGVSLHGGTFVLRAPQRYFERLARITELIAFATLSLLLETRFLRDIACPRPAPPPLASPSELESSAASQDDHTPEHIAFQRSQTIDDRSHSHPGSSSRWSRTNLWQFITGSSATSSTTSDDRSSKRDRLKQRLRDIGGGLKTRRKGDRGTREGSDSTAVAIPRGPSLELSREHTWAFVGSLDRLPSPKLLPDSSESKKTDRPGPGAGTSKETKRQRQKERDEADRFQNVIRKMEETTLSISPDVVIPPPFLLVKLRRDELEANRANDSRSRIDDDAADDATRRPARPRTYSTVESRAIAMGVASSLDRQEESSSSQAVAGHRPNQVKLGVEARAGLASLLTHNSSLEGVMRHQGIQFLAELHPLDSDQPHSDGPCQAPRWLSFHYYDGRGRDNDDAASNVAADLPIGLFLSKLVKHADEACDSSTCKRALREHKLCWSHSAERISITIHSAASTPSDSIAPDDTLRAWTRCKICDAQTTPNELTTASLCFSFAKFAELLLYDPNLVPEPQLCEHAPVERGALVRCFSMLGTVVSVELEPITLFELQMPRSVPGPTASEATDARDLSSSERDQASAIAEDVEAFYGSLFRRIDQLAVVLRSHKPAAESTDQGGLTRSDSQKTVKGRLAADVPEKVSNEAEDDDEDEAPEQLVDNLKTFYRRRRDELVKFTKTIDDEKRNDARWVLIGRTAADERRLDAWQRKHIKLVDGLELVPLERPHYWQADCRPLPVGSSVIVRKDELSSAVALALSSPSYKQCLDTGRTETGKISSEGLLPPAPSSEQGQLAAPRPPFALDLFANVQPATTEAGSSLSSSASSIRSNRSSVASGTDLDPDDLTADFAKRDEIEVTAQPRKPARALGSMIFKSVRGLGKQMSIDNLARLRPSPVSTPLEETFPSSATSTAKSEDQQRKLALSDSVLEKLVSESSAISKPAPSTFAMSTPSVISSLSKGRTASSPARASLASAAMSPSRSVDNVQATTASGATVEIDPSCGRGETYGVATGTAALSALRFREASGTASVIISTTTVENSTKNDSTEDASAGKTDRAFGLGSLLSIPSSLRRPSPAPDSNASSNTRAIDGAAGVDGNTTGHVKFKVKDGDKLLRVTIYHARKFETLRTRCGIDEKDFIQSLSRCEEHTPSGGKSSARFWITNDRKYVLKELKEAWPVSERDAFLQFAPHLIDYLLESENRPSLLTKIFGFYTIKRKNLTTKETSKVHLVVMHNLFASETITRHYDLKGIATRVASRKAAAADDTTSDPASSTQATGWDRDWLTGSLDTRLLIYAHSKVLLREALSADCAFLARQECVDYSLLVGVDDSKRTIHVGLIDTLGTFNALKRLESLSKTSLKIATMGDAESVTVVPPREYADRFKQAMASYFIAVPEKLTRPIGEDEAMAKPRLASVL